jgi:acyl-CoA reductase-like NAD-dependent aldehyde dehydrogenase
MDAYVSERFDLRMRVRDMWVDGSQRDSTPVINPATGEIIAHVPEATADDARAALEAARRAQPIWAALTPRERATCLRRVGELVRKDVERLARIISLEEGKPLREARFEIEGWTAGFFEYLLDFGRAAYGEVLPSDNSQQLDDLAQKDTENA